MGKEKSSLTKFFNNNQIELPLKIIVIITVGHFLHIDICDRFLLVSGKQPDGLYAKSLWDFTFIFFYFCVFTFMRAATMNFILKPSSLWLNVSKDKVSRFAEQGWLVLYYSISFASGLAIFYNSPYWKDTSYYWKDYPVWEMKGYFKCYYLLQFAFWLQQPFVLQTEEPRKDYVEYMIHHINTILLIGLSYGCNFMAIGNAVFVCMDLPDFFLSLAKVLHYVGSGTVCNLIFVAMVISWIYTRVYYYGRIIWSVFTEPELYIPNFKLDPLNGLWFPHFVKYVIMALMLGLYALIIFWTFMIFKVLTKLSSNKEIEDIRSDDEESTKSDKTKSFHVAAPKDNGIVNGMSPAKNFKKISRCREKRKIDIYTSRN